ncbi:MAG TPA: hypothetical protein VKB86_17630 [Pyrinomonadaceae bacterium]|nr:hypothetical protein [Pyrinomonadaceae bacterium]
MKLSQRWKQVSLPNKLMVISTTIMAFATVFLVIAAIFQFLTVREQTGTAKEQLKIVREQSNSMQGQLNAIQEQANAMREQTNTMRDTLTETQKMVRQNERIVGAAETQANASLAQAETAKQSVGFAASSARAALQTAQTASQSFVIGERPYVWVKELHLNDLIAGKRPSVEVIFENAGRTPALNFLQQTQFAPTNQPLTDIVGYGQTKTAPSQGFIPAGGTISKTQTNPIPIDKSDVDAIESGRVLLYFYGIASYDDGIGKKHTLKFCGLYVPSRNTFQACSFYNSTD